MPYDRYNKTKFSSKRKPVCLFLFVFMVFRFRWSRVIVTWNRTVPYSPHMASVERKQDEKGPFYLGYGSRRQTSAEIVTEARHSLRTLRTQRPFTPRQEHRQLFAGSARTRDGRPPSSFRFWEEIKKNLEICFSSVIIHLLKYSIFWNQQCRFFLFSMLNKIFFIISYSLHARNFEAPDSRPSSGTRLSPLEHVRRFFQTLLKTCPIRWRGC